MLIQELQLFDVPGKNIQKLNIYIIKSLPYKHCSMLAHILKHNETGCASLGTNWVKENTHDYKLPTSVLTFFIECFHFWQFNQSIATFVTCHRGSIIFTCSTLLLSALKQQGQNSFNKRLLSRFPPWTNWRREPLEDNTKYRTINPCRHTNENAQHPPKKKGL